MCYMLGILSLTSSLRSYFRLLDFLDFFGRSVAFILLFATPLFDLIPKPSNHIKTIKNTLYPRSQIRNQLLIQEFLPLSFSFFRSLTHFLCRSFTLSNVMCETTPKYIYIYIYIRSACNQEIKRVNKLATTAPQLTHSRIDFRFVNFFLTP